MSDYPIAHRINAGQNGYFAKDWYTRQQISVGNDYGDFNKQTNQEIHNQDSTHHNYVSRFLGCHPNDDLNLHKGETIIAYAPKQDVLIGVGAILSDPIYDPEPTTLTTKDRHPYWRDIAWLPWSKPVDTEELRKIDERFVEDGVNRAFPTSTLERYNGDFTGLKEAIEKCDGVDLNEL